MTEATLTYVKVGFPFSICEISRRSSAFILLTVMILLVDSSSNSLINLSIDCKDLLA